MVFRLPPVGTGGGNGFKQVLFVSIFVCLLSGCLSSSSGTAQSGVSEVLSASEAILSAAALTESAPTLPPPVEAKEKNPTQSNIVGPQADVTDYKYEECRKQCDQLGSGDAYKHLKCLERCRWQQKPPSMRAAPVNSTAPEMPVTPEPHKEHAPYIPYSWKEKDEYCATHKEPSSWIYCNTELFWSLVAYALVFTGALVWCLICKSLPADEKDGDPRQSGYTPAVGSRPDEPEIGPME
uniref:Uncharacterized protein n=1 Tax=Chromera velia CCMP2878 TaxID=1169474 RepID=A0A0G4H1C4_9ALVE|mmetsp:Transcript_49333/g.97192  ORF Transcript_49333/g.97192 Transcript_49333/m.97192 type:complete len:238 (-) Transcript_49333:305-1018(-)|eukprot:Cvel_5538.t1-p1 / transcript=Cvel_5538.t1 / gene=Cvel_5538 / organism=Chromera_velia_CCMP2878 / gene_product=hypothetical protein / transcript_product=hypothetical protein / location=Cvel_scaffold259:77282-79924(-) / protein_length=237 / sequence_SO=supercontig / SO=protein_coding / is_pseudo=false